MIQTDVNEQYQFDFDESDQERTLNETLYEADLVHLGGQRYHALKDHYSYTIEIITVEPADKTVTLTINGHEYTVEVQDRYDLLLEKLGMAEMAGTKVNEIEAPMPGKVLNINVEEGDEVEAEQGVLVLEAMKMENVIKTVDEGVIQTIHVEEGEKVEKSQLLIELE